MLANQPSSTMKGIQKSINWTLESMACPFARGVGGEDFPRSARMDEYAKYTMEITPSAEAETRGKMITPKHLGAYINREARRKPGNLPHSI